MFFRHEQINFVNSEDLRSMSDNLKRIKLQLGSTVLNSNVKGSSRNFASMLIAWQLNEENKQRQEPRDGGQCGLVVHWSSCIEENKSRLTAALMQNRDDGPILKSSKLKH